jgi:thioredoxin-like negative regulator of GroEL
MDTQMERKQVYIPGNLVQRLNRYAAIKQLNASEVMRDALEEYLCEQERNLAFKDDEFLQVLNRGFGMWKNRDPEEFQKTRRSLDRKLWED